ncbi:hypothetical protein GCM10007989_29830 [Devosia pacifica]|uniref:CENP-V/GFA domain-containing protein n=1 Tax=Devosia pacifica TaxID=1335967 RepID=A0A918VWN1_9HYPH|nr:GFA family protein [Devosia pacifica]GHA31797.1 hypothetical protein GCM10007989_29830 [Devosia pacifica]
MDKIYEGGCRCGAVRYKVEGAPQIVGLCHCAECRKETGSAFLHYADWPMDRFSVEGRYETYDGRSFCPRCGGTLFHLSEEESRAEIAIASLDAAPSAFTPHREGWIKRRESWLTACPEAEQFKEDPV